MSPNLDQRFQRHRGTVCNFRARETREPEISPSVAFVIRGAETFVARAAPLRIWSTSRRALVATDPNAV